MAVDIGVTTTPDGGYALHLEDSESKQGISITMTEVAMLTMASTIIDAVSKVAVLRAERMTTTPKLLVPDRKIITPS